MSIEELDRQVEYRWAWDWRWEHPQDAGRVIGVCDAPQYLIERPDGSKFWWRKDLTREAQPHD